MDIEKIVSYWMEASDANYLSMKNIMAEATDSRILELVNQYIKKLKERISVERVILFGSYAKNRDHKDSDIDLAIVSRDFSGNPISDFLTAIRVCREVDLRLEPHPFLPQDFENNPFADEIIRYGIEILV